MEKQFFNRIGRKRSPGRDADLPIPFTCFATELADRVSIIERGEIRYEGRPAELAAHPEVREKYLMV
jgi:hypothetical protein